MAPVNLTNSPKEKKAVSLYQIDPTFYKKILSRSPSKGVSSDLYRPEVPFVWEMNPGQPRDGEETADADQQKKSTLYQLDPAFYKKILNRNTSFGRSSRNCGLAGQVPFNWENEPGEPKDVPKIERVLPTPLPPPPLSLTKPRPQVLPPSGVRAYFLKNIKKVKKIKNVQLSVPLTVPNFGVSRKDIFATGAMKYLIKKIKVNKINGIDRPKAYLMTKVKRVKKTKVRINLVKKTKVRLRGKNGGSCGELRSKAKKIQTRFLKSKRNVQDEEADDSDEYESCNSDFESLTQSTTTTTASTTPSTSKNSSSSSFRSPTTKLSGLWSALKPAKKWSLRNNKPIKVTDPVLSQQRKESK